MKLANNIGLLTFAREGMGSLHLVLAWDEKNLVLIDAGVPGQTDDIVKAIADAGHKAEDLTHLIITHQDWDHVGCVADLRKIAPSLQIVAHADEAEYLDGRTLPIKLAARLQQRDTMTDEQKTAVDRWNDMYTNSPTPVHIEVQDKENLPICGGIEIVHVPGHTPGHIAVYFKEANIIVCGDAVNIRDGQLVGSSPIFTHDMPQAEASFEKIKDYSAAGIVAYHGGFMSL